VDAGTASAGRRRGRCEGAAPPLPVRADDDRERGRSVGSGRRRQGHRAVLARLGALQHAKRPHVGRHGERVSGVPTAAVSQATLRTATSWRARAPGAADSSPPPRRIGADEHEPISLQQGLPQQPRRTAGDPCVGASSTASAPRPLRVGQGTRGPPGPRRQHRVEADRVSARLKPSFSRRSRTPWREPSRPWWPEKRRGEGRRRHRWPAGTSLPLPAAERRGTPRRERRKHTPRGRPVGSPMGRVYCRSAILPLPSAPEGAGRWACR